MEVRMMDDRGYGRKGQLSLRLSYMEYALTKEIMSDV